MIANPSDVATAAPDAATPSATPPHLMTNRPALWTKFPKAWGLLPMLQYPGPYCRNDPKQVVSALKARHVRYLG